MKRALILPALVLTLLAPPSSVAQTSRTTLDPSKIYITSYFDCPVFWGRRQIAILPRRTRAQILRSTRKWILVRFWRNGKYITGWIRR